jgi:integrase
MGIFKRGRTWHFRKRVPRRFEALDPRRPVVVSLKTDSRSIAEVKAAEVERELVRYWLALEGGHAPGARARYDAAVAYAQVRGVAYRSAAELAEGPLEELVARLLRLQATGELRDAAAVNAELGGVERPAFSLTEALEVFLAETGDRRAGMSAAQVKKWEAPRRRAVEEFVALRGDKPLAEIRRDDAVAFRTMWRQRLENGKAVPNTANKSIGHLSDLFKSVVELRQLGLENPFAKLKLRNGPERRRPSFTAAWIRERILAPGALDGLNPEARDVLLMMVNTGAGLAEVAGARLADLAVAAEVPHLVIEPHEGRRLKTGHRGRSVPLLGVSLEAARRRVAAGGFPRYADAADTLSAVVNKFLRENGLLPGPGFSAYSLRHAFQDRLTAVEAPERIAADLMGHKLARPRYGAGPGLEQKAEWIARIAL